MSQARNIVVGFDGTRASARAVRFAAEEAARRETDLRIVHVHEEGDPSDEVDPTTAVGIARGYVDPHRINAVEATGWPAAVLLAQSRDAELIVVGRGGPYRVGAALGSTSQAVVTTARRPVVVLAGTDPSAADPDAAANGVVVGVKHLDSAEEVLTVAFAEAELRNCPLEVVHSWRHAGEHSLRHVLLPTYADPIRFVEEISDRLQEAVGLVGDKFPEVPVIVATPHASAYDALMTAAQGAALLVVGAPAVGPVRGALLGSAGQAILREGGCPVLFVPRPA